MGSRFLVWDLLITHRIAKNCEFTTALNWELLIIVMYIELTN